MANATSGGDPYSVPVVTDTNPDPNIVETTIVADETTIDIGGGVTANAYTYNGTVPGPEFRLTPGQRVIVHFENHLLDEPSGIHWHGIELANASDGTTLTQNQVAAGDSFLYDFVAPRAGMYWYHPHHEFSNNQVFKGLYGTIIVTDPNEAALIASGVLPGAADTLTLALSDVTVCKDADPNNDGDISDSQNDDDTYPDSLPWAGGGPLPEQPSPFPSTLCDTPVDNHGDPLPGPLPEHDIPNVSIHSGRVNEGQIVLTNGMDVGGRGGTPEAPGGLDGDAFTMDVQPGQGLRLQAGSEATLRFFRLRLTDSAGANIPLVRVGGEGGLLDDAVVEGTAPGPGNFDFKYPQGEILLDPGDRADVVAAIPDTAAPGPATLWTLDFPRIGGGAPGGWTNIPTVPVAHFNVTGAPVAPAYTIGAGTPLRSATGDPQVVLPAPGPTETLLDPASFGKTGLPSQNIKLTSGVPSVDNVPGTHDFSVDYTVQPYDGSTRWAKLGDTLELSVTNDTSAHHPFHLHGFSLQPLSYNNCTDLGGAALPVPGFTFPEPEYMDNIDVPAKCTLTYRIKLEDRPHVDGTTPGGGLGRWVFHCHIFFHHHRGMTSEVVVTDADGNERPYVDAVAPSVTVPEGGDATMDGTVFDVDGDAVSLTASLGTVTDNGDGTWSWSYTPPDGPLASFVYITATDANGNTGQTTFILEADNVPPTVTIDPAQVTAIDEGGTLSVSATFTDPGDDDPYTATIDFGTGAGPQPATAVVTNPTPPQSGTVGGSHQYGDNGIFHVTVTVTDKDGATGSAGFDVTVANVDPDATITTPEPVIADVNQAVNFAASATDPGSDDLTTTWNFDDGSPNAVQVSLVNPPGSDPLPSPSVQPRNVTHNASHAFTDACAYDVGFRADDDDGGTDSDSLLVIITAAPSLSRGAGYWQKQYGGQGVIVFTPAQLQCYLDIAAALSGVFNEVRSAATIAQAFNDIFVAGLHGNMREQLDRQLLTAWVNFANGGVEYSELLDTNNNGVPDTTFANVMATAEAVRLNGAATKAQLQAQRDILSRINARDGL